MDDKRLLRELEDSRSKIRKLEEERVKSRSKIRDLQDANLVQTLEIENLKKTLGATTSVEVSAFTEFFGSLASLRSDGQFLRLPPGVFWMGIRVLGGSMLIRDCYIKLMDRILETHRTAEQEQRPRTMFIITGTPGIGKSFFSFYWLHRRIRERKPVLFEFQEFCLFWSPDGKVIKSNRETFMQMTTRPDMLYLCDSRRDIHSPTGCLTIFFSSPQAKNFHDFLKNGAEVLYMPLWSLDELETARAGLYGDRLPKERVDAAVAVYGCVPRYVLDKPFKIAGFANWKRKDVERDKITLGREHTALQEAIRRSDPAEYFNFKVFQGPSDAMKFSYQIQHVDTKNFVDPEYGWASPFLFRRMMECHTHVMADSLLNLFNIADQIPRLGVVAGSSLELMIHEVLPLGCAKYQLSILRRRSSDTDEVSRKPQLCSRESSVYTFLKLEEISEVQAGVYYKPQSKTQVSFDSFMVVNNDLLIFQATFVRRHPVKLEGLEELLPKARNIHRNRRAFLIFIVPTNHLNSFKTEQPYHTREGRVAKELPADIRSVKQCVLAIDDGEVRNNLLLKYRPKVRR